MCAVCEYVVYKRVIGINVLISTDYVVDDGCKLTGRVESIQQRNAIDAKVLRIFIYDHRKCNISQCISIPLEETCN